MKKDSVTLSPALQEWQKKRATVNPSLLKLRILVAYIASWVESIASGYRYSYKMPSEMPWAREVLGLLIRESVSSPLASVTRITFFIDCRGHGKRFTGFSVGAELLERNRLRRAFAVLLDLDVQFEGIMT